MIKLTRRAVKIKEKINEKSRKCVSGREKNAKNLESKIFARQMKHCSYKSKKCDFRLQALIKTFQKRRKTKQ
jgi:hypothetical protein